MQGLIVIAVVVSYETVRRYGVRRQQRQVGAELAAGHVPAPPTAPRRRWLAVSHRNRRQPAARSSPRLRRRPPDARPPSSC